MSRTGNQRSKQPSAKPSRPKPGKVPVGSRSFARRQRTERERVTRKQLKRVRSRPSIDLRAALRRVPTAARVCVLVALLNALTWSLITPPFQGRDEIDHFAYTEQLAETGTLPHSPSLPPSYPSHEGLVMLGLHYWQSRFTSYTPAISSAAEQRALIAADDSSTPVGRTGEAGGAWSAPPLYYALQTIPYALGAGNVLVQLQLMRLFSVLLGALTALLVFLFLREILPSVPWAATVGALCVALQPQFAFISGSVNPDVLLYALSAGIFLCLARAFRRGVTRRLAVVLGVLIAAGLVTYFSFIGVAFGALAALVVLAVREAKSRNLQALVSLAIAAGIGVAPGVLYALRNLLVGHPAFGVASGVGSATGAQSIFDEISYVWELYLPRLPGMAHYFTGTTTWKDIWFNRSVGLYGWMDVTFPGWVDSIALIAAAAVTLLCSRELVKRRHALRARLPELASYAAIMLGVLLTIGVASYDSDVVKQAGAFGEPRYLLPLLPLLGAVVTLAVRGAGRRWIPVAGAAIVVLFLGHDLFSQLQAIGRYYG
jgi:Predicted membrane protein (DUF2142)